MFGKKILSIVGLLFVSSQLVYADENCTYGGNQIATADFCNGKVYLLNNSGNAKIDNSLASGCTSGGNECILVNCPTSTCEKSESYNGLITTDGELFSCTNGDCINVDIATLGGNNYLVNDIDENNLFVGGNNGGTIEVKTNFNGQDFCVDKNWAIYERKNGLCNADVDDEDEDCTHYYDCTEGESCTVSLSNRDPNADCVPTVDTKCAAGYYLVDGGELSTESGALWKCFGKNGDNCQNKDSDHQIGFLVNAGSDDTNTKYIQCAGTTGSCTIAPIGNDCVATETVGKATYGQLYKENLGSSYELCLYDGGKKSITIGDPKKYLIEKKANILGFTKDEIVDTKYVVLEVDAYQNILPVAKTAVGYYSTTSATSYEVVTVPTDGVTLYSCAADTNGLKCGQVSSKPIGYLKNQVGTGTATYIYCQKSGTCDAIAVTGTSCEATASGPAVTTGSLHTTNKFCVYNSGDESIELTGANKGMYFVSAATSLFGLTRNDDSFIVVKLDEQGNLTVVKEGTSVRYRYTLDTDPKNKIHTRAQAKEETGPGGICNDGTPKEFTLIQWTSIDSEADYYIATPTD